MKMRLRMRGVPRQLEDLIEGAGGVMLGDELRNGFVQHFLLVLIKVDARLLERYDRRVFFVSYSAPELSSPLSASFLLLGRRFTPCTQQRCQNR